MPLTLLTDCYMVDIDEITEVLFYPSNGTEPAKVVIYTRTEDKTAFYNDEAITVWHRLKNVVAAQAEQ